MKRFDQSSVIFKKIVGICQFVIPFCCNLIILSDSNMLSIMTVASEPSNSDFWAIAEQGLPSFVDQPE